jgi:hypothetical protein
VQRDEPRQDGVNYGTPPATVGIFKGYIGLLYRAVRRCGPLRRLLMRAFASQSEALAKTTTVQNKTPVLSMT